MGNETSKTSGNRLVYIETDYSVPTFGPCMARPVYLKNSSSTQQRVVVKITKPKYMTKCEPMTTTRKWVSVSGNNKVFLGYNAVNCSGSILSVRCKKVSYRL